MFRNNLTRLITYDERSLAVFRILLGVMVLVDLLDRAQVFEVMYTDHGLTPVSYLREFYGRDVINLRHFSLHMLSGNAYFQGGLFVVAALCAIGLSVGWKTRLFAVASWALHASIVTRNPIYVSGADVTLGLMLFWAIFLPIGRTRSFDARQRKSSESSNKTLALVGGACFLIQVCVVYVSAGLAKGEWWHDGSALMNIMNYDMVVTEFGHRLTEFPHVLRWLTRSTFYLELFGTALLLLPFYQQAARALCVAMFMGLHLGIGLTLDIGPFPLFSMVLWIPFIPGTFWELVGIRTRPDNNLLHGSGIPFFSIRDRVTVVSSVIAVGTLLCVIVSTVPGINRLTDSPLVGRPVNSYLSFIKMRQAWTVFANEKNMSRDGWFSVQGTLSDGTEVDILRDFSPVDYEKPTLTGKKRRLPVVWTTYLARQERNDRRNLDQFARYLNWKYKQSNGGEGFRYIRMIFIEEPIISIEGQDPKRIVFWEGSPP